MSERLSALEKEVARLRRQNTEVTRELDLARERVRELESARDFALDRIDWALDSLHNTQETER